MKSSRAYANAKPGATVTEKEVLYSYVVNLPPIPGEKKTLELPL